MLDADYKPGQSGLLLVDPYNDCLSEGGKFWPKVRGKSLRKHLQLRVYDTWVDQLCANQRLQPENLLKRVINDTPAKRKL